MKTLDELSNKYSTDKGSQYPGPSRHGYASIYEDYLQKWKNDPIRLLEVGVCMEGTTGGHSVRVWHEYFPNAEIYGFDIVNMKSLETEMNRVKIFQGDQSKREDFELMYSHFGEKEFDFILEDGSHQHEHQMISFGHLFKYVKSGGYYILEDMSVRGVPTCCIRNDESLDIIQKFYETGIIESKYIKEEEKNYIEKNTLKVDLYQDIQGAYKTAIIHKK